MSLTRQEQDLIAYGLGLGAGAALVISLTYAVLALVRCAPLTSEPDRSRSRATRRPLPSSPGSRAHRVNASSASSAPSSMTAESK